MTVQFKALPTEEVRALQAGGADSNGQLPERKISEWIRMCFSMRTRKSPSPKR